MIALYTHATGCFVRDSVDPDYIPTFPFYSTEHCLGYLSWRFIIWFGILYFAERVYREVRSRRTTEISKVMLHPSGAMEVRFLKASMKYKAGQWLFLNCPEVSKYQWHPVRPSIQSSTTYKPAEFTADDVAVYHILSPSGSIHLCPHSSSRRFHPSPRPTPRSHRHSQDDPR